MVEITVLPVNDPPVAVNDDYSGSEDQTIAGNVTDNDSDPDGDLLVVNTVPDMLVIGKGLGGGVYPLAALMVREHLDVAPDRALGHYTHEKSPVGCAAGLATLQVIEEEGLLERADRLGARALARLGAIADGDARIRNLRGVGLLLGVEFVPGNRDDVAPLAENLMYNCLSAGLSFKISMGRIATLAPALTIEEDELDRGLEILAKSLAASA